MNVLYVIDSTTLSGAEVVLLHYLNAFGPPDHHPHVFLRRENRRLIEALTSRGVPHTTTEAFSSRLLVTTANPAALAHFARSFVRTTRELRRVIEQNAIDLIHSISYPTSLYAAFAARATGRRQVWHEHNIKRIHRVNARIYRWTASTCAWVIGPSDAVTRNLAKAGIPAARLRTVYNGIDLGRFTPDDRRADAVRQELGVGPDRLAVALCGQMLPYKGHATLIDAATRLKDRWPDVAYFFVGALENPPYEAELRERIDAAGLTGQIRFTGWRPDVADVIRAMDAVVVATTTPEPAALSLMETMAMGRPIVATPTGGTPEILLDGVTGLLFPPGDGPALADRLARLLADPALRGRMGEEGRARVVKNYSLSRHLEEMLALYQQALAPASEP